MTAGMDIAFRVLGPVEVQVDGREIVLGAPKQRVLLGVLLANANVDVSTSRLIEEVWGDDAPAGPRRSLQVYVSALRAALGPAAGVLQTASQGYRLRVKPEQLDARCFERVAAAARALLERGEAAAAVEQAAAALALWRGPAFADVADFPFARAETTRLEALRLETIEIRIEAALTMGHHHQVVAELAALVDEHPLRERLRAQMMLALHRCGRQAEALAVYRAGRRQLVDELGLEPGQQLRSLHEAILRDDPRLSVEPAELRARRHLPATLTPLIGRRAEVEQLMALLQGESVRLVTVTGPGGIGKTRLALQVAHDLAADFPDGVFFVGLAELRDPALVIPTVAVAFGVDEPGDQALLSAVQAFLRERQLLVLLDNFEHVEQAAPLVGELLSAAPRVRALVTSRSLLRIYGEQGHALGGLNLEDEAVPLFVATATAVDPRFALTERVAGAVREVCLQLDCLPLAIELAAARAAELTPAEMLAVLPRRLELAGSGPRDRPERQQALRTAIDWSYRLLSADEQRLFASLAVFVGGCTADAAREVCGGTQTQLTSLAAKNLVLRRADGDSSRYSMLETIREFALESLPSAPSPSGSPRGQPDHEVVRDRHARCFLGLAERAMEELRGADQLWWISRLNTERDNLRAALTHFLDGARNERPGSGELAVRLAAALGFYWYKTGAVAEGSRWLERALEVAPDAADLDRGRALHCLGVLVAEHGEAERGLVLCEASCELFRRAGDLAWVARSLNSQGGIARDLGHFERAEQRFEESADLRRSLGDVGAPLAIVLLNLAMVALDRRDLARARRFGEECLEMARDSNQWIYAATLPVLADVAIAEQDIDRAAEYLQLALPALRSLGDYRLIECLDCCAGLAACLGRAEWAARLVGAADAALEELGAQIVPADARMREHRIAAARDALGPDQFEVARHAGRAMSLDEALDAAFNQVIPRPRPGAQQTAP